MNEKSSGGVVILPRITAHGQGIYWRNDFTAGNYCISTLMLIQTRKMEMREIFSM
jgi:hypothetical protein